jgi:hypothetical protein
MVEHLSNDFDLQEGNEGESLFKMISTQTRQNLLVKILQFVD